MAERRMIQLSLSFEESLLVANSLALGAAALTGRLPEAVEVIGQLRLNARMLGADGADALTERLAKLITTAWPDTNVHADSEISITILDLGESDDRA